MTDILWQGSEKESFDQWSGALSIGGFARDTNYSREAFRFDDVAAYVRGFADTAQTDEFGAGWYLLWGDGVTGAAGTGRLCCELQDSSGVGQVALLGTSTTALYNIGLWNGASYDILGSANAGVGNAGWWNLAVTGIGTSGGTVIFQLNGITLAEFTSQDFTGFSDIQYVHWGFMGGRSDASEFGIGNGTMVGHRTKTVVANANGAETDGTGSYTDVNESGINYSNFWELPTAGDARSVKSSARTLTNPAFDGVTVSGTLMRVDASGPQQAKPFLRIGGTNYYGDTYALTTGWLQYQYTWLLNPATTAEWTASEVNDATMEWGWEAVT